MPADGPPFEDVLDAVAALPAHTEDRIVVVHDTPARLNVMTTSTSARIRQGELVRIRMDQIPVRASLTGEVGTFPLDDDEGVGEETAFLYHDNLAVLALQRNRLGITNYGFVRYFTEHAQDLLDMDGFITLVPVLEPATMARLAQVQVVRRFDVRFAGVHNPQALLGDAPSPGVSKMLDLIETFEAPSAHIELSMGHERTGSLDVQRVKRTARRLLRIEGGAEGDRAPIRRIEIHGRTDDEEPLVLDLLQDRMIEYADLELDAERHLPYARRRRALRDAFSRRRDQLRSLFGQAE
jgi:hypothetical protein